MNSPLTGNVDGIAAGTLRGWLHDASVLSSAELNLLADGEVVARAVADRRRSDVEERAGIDPACGFEFDLVEIGSTCNRTLGIVHEASGHDFHASAWTYCEHADAAVAKHRGQLHGLFFAEYYRHRYGLETLSNEECFQYYASNGIYQGHDPCPWFSSDYFREHHGDLLGDCDLPVLAYLRHQHDHDVRPSALFDPAHYARAYPDLKNMALLQHYVGHGHAEGRHPVERRVPAAILEELEELVAIDPSIATVRADSTPVVRYPFPRAATYAPRLVQRRFGSDIEAVVCVPFITIGGADLVGIYMLRAYQRAFGVDRVLLIVTEAPAIDVPDWLERGTHVLCLQGECDFVDHDEKIDTLHNIIGLLAPSRIMNVNSHATWDMYRKYGAQLATATEINAYVFCFDQTPAGRLVGYIASYLPDLIGLLANVYCDNLTIIDQIRELYGFSRQDMAKFEVVYVPAPENMRVCTDKYADDVARRSNAPILWIGRLSDQKRPELLVRIAAAMPTRRFVVYGPGGNSPCSAPIIAGDYPNIEYRGVFTDINEIDGDEYSLFLNTSLWDGIPQTVIQIVGMGIPMVSSMAGGIAELVTEESGWAVQDGESVLDYIAQISRALIQKERAKEKVRVGQALFAERHTWQAFCRRLEVVGAFESTRGDTAPASVFLDRRKASPGATDHARTITLPSSETTGSIATQRPFRVVAG